jgi:hypothetical protein
MMVVTPAQEIGRWRILWWGKNGGSCRDWKNLPVRKVSVRLKKIIF